MSFVKIPERILLFYLISLALLFELFNRCLFYDYLFYYFCSLRHAISNFLLKEELTIFYGHIVSYLASPLHYAVNYVLTSSN